MDARTNPAANGLLGNAKRRRLIALAAAALAWSGYQSFTAKPAIQTTITPLAAKKIESPEHAVRFAAIRFVRALSNGDLAKAESLAISSADSRRMVEAMAKNYQSARELKGALSLRFSEENEADLVPMLKLLGQAKVEITGDHAELSQRANGESLPFEHVDGHWLIDAAEVGRRRKMPADPTATVSQRAAAATRIAAAVREGRYRSAEEAMADHSRQLESGNDAQASTRD